MTELCTVPTRDMGVRRRRAKCCGEFRGPWRENEAAAEEDLLAHLLAEHECIEHRGFTIIKRADFDHIIAGYPHQWGKCDVPLGHGYLRLSGAKQAVAQHLRHRANTSRLEPLRKGKNPRLPS